MSGDQGRAGANAPALFVWPRLIPPPRHPGLDPGSTFFSVGSENEGGCRIRSGMTKRGLAMRRGQSQRAALPTNSVTPDLIRGPPSFLTRRKERWIPDQVRD